LKSDQRFLIWICMAPWVTYAPANLYARL
jgi:hypothetical protein